MPNLVATLALLVWPLVALYLYRTRPLAQATLWTILGAQMLLPVGAEIKLHEGIPGLDKVSLPNIATLIGCLLLVQRPSRMWRRFGFAGVLILMNLVGPFITAELNGDPIIVGNTVLPSETHYDAVSAAFNQFLFVLPFFVGRLVLRGSTENEETLRVLAIAGLLYSIPMLLEIRLSPQLHFWLYGYYPSEFLQQMRENGFRPVVFMGHGLIVAFFAMTTAVAAAALWRIRSPIMRLQPGIVTGYLSVLLVLCKSLGALSYGAVLVPLVRLATPRLQLRVALVLVSVALLYPLLRTTDLFPTTGMVEVAKSISGERANSLEFRFTNEDRLLQRASQRLFFGWGRFGRSRVYDESGKDVSVTDGFWIIVLGTYGLFGFIAEFGLLVFPVVRAVSAVKFVESKREAVLLGALALIIATNVVDLLPNATISPWTWLLAGALLGRVESIWASARRQIQSRSNFTKQGIGNIKTKSRTS